MFTEHDGDEASALALVISLNVQRRDLSAGQRAIVAAKALPMFEESAKQRMAEGPRTMGGTISATHRSRDDAAKIFKVGVNQVQQAKLLLKEAPDLAAQVETRILNVTNAYAQYQEREEEGREDPRD